MKSGMYKTGKRKVNNRLAKTRANKQQASRSFKRAQKQGKIAKSFKKKAY